MIDHGAARLFGRHVRGRPEHDTRFGNGRGASHGIVAERADQFGQTEVDDLGVSVLGHHHVGGPSRWCIH